MIKYVKCPRCELNYINAEEQEYCDVCLAEMHGDKLQFAELDDDELEQIDAELEGELCPICGVNPIRYGEKMCESCRQENSAFADEEEEIDIDKDEEWKNYLDEDEGEDLTVDDESLQEELDEELDEEDEEFEEDDTLSDFDEDFDDDFDEDFDDEDDEDDDDDFDDEDDDF